jgi:nucleoid DNA-binding protein
MDMEQYILDLIRENNRVIIPNFGAFIVAHEKGVTILFNNFLTFNDGLLIDYVKEKDGVDTLEATDRVSHFVARINDTLETTGEFELKGLGKFTRDTTGILRFQQDEHLNDTFGGETVPEEEKNEELLDLETSDEQEVTQTVEEKKDDTTLIVPPGQSEEEKQKEETKDEEEEKKYDSKPKTDPYKEDKKKETVALFVILFVLIPVIGFALYYFIFSDNSKGSDGKEKVVIEQPKTNKKPLPKPVKQEKPTTKSEIVAGPVSTVTVKSDKKKEVKVPVVKQRRHFIIVGSFKDQANAMKYADNMKQKGFTSSVTIPKNGRYLVGVESFTSLTKAMARQEELLNKYKLESWILTVKP